MIITSDKTEQDKCEATANYMRASLNHWAGLSVMGLFKRLFPKDLAPPHSSSIFYTQLIKGSHLPIPVASQAVYQKIQI